MATIKMPWGIFILLLMVGNMHGFKDLQNKGAHMSLIKKDFSKTLDLAINMYEKDNYIIADVNIAGIDPQDVQVEIENGQLHVFGERRAKEEIKEENYYYKESAYGRFDRLISLPNNIDKSGMTYDIEKGMLKIIIPKK